MCSPLARFASRANSSQDSRLFDPDLYFVFCEDGRAVGGITTYFDGMPRRGEQDGPLQDPSFLGTPFVHVGAESPQEKWR